MCPDTRFLAHTGPLRRHARCDGCRVRRSVLVSCSLAIALCASVAQADDGVDHAFDTRRPPNRWDAGDALRMPTLSGFNPGDPRVGVVLLMAYAPTPFMIVESVAQDLESQPFDILELLIATAGTVASIWGFVDSFDHPLDAGLAIESLATAHALSWNLQLLEHSLLRLLLGDTAEQFGSTEASFLPFTVGGGGGVVAQWIN